jgi:hypothetical protein
MENNNGNGARSLTRLVWWAVGIGASLTIAAGGFFATSYMRGLERQINDHDAVMQVRSERINLLEGRIQTLENTSAASLGAITRSLDKMETWQTTVQQDIADIKAAMKVKP